MALAIRSSLLGSRRRIALIVVVAVVGAIGIAFAFGLLGVPEVTEVENRFGGVNETTTVIETDLHVQNPNPFGASAGGLTITYIVDMNDVRMADGGGEGITLDRGESVIEFTSFMDNERLPDWWVSHVENDEVTVVTVDADVRSGFFDRSVSAPAVERTVETDIIGAFDNEYDPPQPLSAGADPIVEDPVLYLEQTNGSWAGVTEDETHIDMEFTVYNPKEYPIHVETIGYDVRMNDINMGEGRTEQAYTIPPGQTETIEATTTIQNDNLDDWWVSHLERNQVTHLEIDFFLVVDLSELGAGEHRIQFDTMTETIETDIFGTKEDSETDPVDDPTPTPTPAPGDDDPDDDTTPTPTPEDDPDDDATPTPTPTPEPTPTPDDDDDGVGIPV